MHSPALEDVCTSSRCTGERCTTRNSSRLRDNASRIIVKTMIVYDIIPQLRKLLLTVNSPRFIQSSLRSMYLRIGSVIHGPYFSRSVYTYLYFITSLVRFAASDRETEMEILCAQRGDKEISSGFVTAEDHASQTRHVKSSAISLIFLFQLDRRHQREVTARSRARSWLLEICQQEIGKAIVRMLRISLNYNLSMSNEWRTVLMHSVIIETLSFRALINSHVYLVKQSCSTVTKSI